MIRFAAEGLSPLLWDELSPLLANHWREIAHFADIPLEIDRERYDALDGSGVLRIFTARADGRLVAYAAFMVAGNLHYKSSLQASQDVLYVDPQYRGKMAVDFIDWCDDQLRVLGVQAVYHHLKAAHDHPRLMQALGYEKVDTIYARRLDRPAAELEPSVAEVVTAA